MFIWPTDVRRITSHYDKNRKHPITGKISLHSGMDIAQSGTHEIYAAAGGTVTRSYNSDSYGECIMILHEIKGKTYETVYAHLRTGSRRVKVNQKVKQGQTIGIMGATGNVTGQHLHFELHVGRWNTSRSNAVNPLPFLKEYSSEPEHLTDGSTYLIQSGDTLSQIASRHNTTVEALIRLNGIKNKNLIYPGQVIKLPSRIIYHVVKKGDTLSEIASQYKTTVDIIAANNNISNPNLIHPGQRIQV
jgi:murein DD-endopeptidase MepM/ murein hydrolase activator NlpD